MAAMSLVRRGVWGSGQGPRLSVTPEWAGPTIGIDTPLHPRGTHCVHVTPPRHQAAPTQARPE